MDTKATKTQADAVVLSLIEELAKRDGVRLLQLDTGDRVRIQLEGVVAFGTVASHAYHWSTLKGINVWPVVLDGTEVQLEIHAKYMEKVGA